MQKYFEDLKPGDNVYQLFSAFKNDELIVRTNEIISDNFCDITFTNGFHRVFARRDFEAVDTEHNRYFTSYTAYKFVLADVKKRTRDYWKKIIG